MLGGNDVIVDPGTYCYTPYPEWRNKFRSTAFHNTLQVNGIEQNDISGGLFVMKPGVACVVTRFLEDEQGIEFLGEVRYLNSLIVHTREIRLSKHGRGIEIRDSVMGSEAASVNICLGPGSENIVFEFSAGKLERFVGLYSDHYGVKNVRIFLKGAIKSGVNILNIKKKI